MKKKNTLTSDAGSILLMYWYGRDIGLTLEEAIEAYFFSKKINRSGWSKRMIGAPIDEMARKLDIDDGKKRLGFLMYHIWEAWKAGTMLSISMDENNWRASKGCNISAEFALDTVIKPMIELEYLEEVKGHDWDIIYPISSGRSRERASFVTRIRPTRILSNIFKASEHSCVEDEDGFVFWDVLLNPVKIRDEKGNDLKMPSSSNRDWKRMVKEMNQINNSNLCHHVSLDKDTIALLNDIEDERLELIRTIKSEIEYVLLSVTGSVAPIPPERLEYVCVYITNGFREEELEKVQYLCDLTRRWNMQNENPDSSPNLMDYFHLTRIFNQRKSKGRGGSSKFFELGGRLYSNGSTMPSKSRPIRQGLLIDGEATSELDYSSLHVAIAASEAGEELGDIDPYWCDDIFWQGLFVNRAQAKEIISALINCKNRRAASSKLVEYGIKLKSVEELLESRGLGWFKDFIGSDSGLRFQKIDSDMAVQICLRFQKATESAILPYHDSFVVQERREGVLRTIMNEVAIEYIGREIKIKKDDKVDIKQYLRIKEEEQCKNEKRETKTESFTALREIHLGSESAVELRPAFGTSMESFTDPEAQQLSEKAVAKSGTKKEEFNAQDLTLKLRSFLERNAG